MKRLSAAASLVVVLAAARPASAHASRTAYVDATVTSDAEATVTFHGPPAMLDGLGVRADACDVATIDPRTFRVRCPGGAAGAQLEVTGLGASPRADVVVARNEGASGEVEGAVLTPRASRLVLPGRASTRGVLARYVRLGAEHVTSGLDHVLFLLALTWQAVAAARGRLRRAAIELARTATAFTLAHTVTLTTTVLGVLTVPTLVAEACIAASLVLAALDLREGEHAAPARGPLARTALAGAFGLVHGLGFASALAGGALPEHAVALGLGAFNVGVELGQAIVLAAGLLALAVLRRAFAPASSRRFADVAAYAVGGIGAFLFLSRTALLLASRTP